MEIAAIIIALGLFLASRVLGGAIEASAELIAEAIDRLADVVEEGEDGCLPLS